MSVPGNWNTHNYSAVSTQIPPVFLFLDRWIFWIGNVTQSIENTALYYFHLQKSTEHVVFHLISEYNQTIKKFKEQG